GKLQTRKWQGQDGQDRYTTEILVDEMQMLDSRGAGQGNYDSPSDNQQRAPSAVASPSSAAGAGAAAPPPGDFNNFDDDIPF
ncbi:MAG: single-stranded DNA-binding protein, partial [Halioglobus sp.]|nr:single-stranded DNA-binding protein [Halioglobus sp.]